MNDLDGACSALKTVAACLDTLASINAGNILLPGSPQSRYHDLLEQAYVALGRIETVVDELSQELEEQHRRLDEARDDALSERRDENRALRLSALLEWERVSAWARVHTRSSWARTCMIGSPAGGDFLGESGSPLRSPLACYLNESWPSEPLRSEWRIDRPTYRAWHSSDPSTHYPLPAWAEQAERLTDSIQGAHQRRERKPVFVPAWLTQEQLHSILEHVKPEKETL